MTPEDARALIATLADDRTRLADRIVTPWWYHPALAVAVGALVLGQLPPSPAWIWTTIPAVLICVTLLNVYRRRYGVAVSRPAGGRSRLQITLVTTVYLACLIAAWAIRGSDVAAAWGLVPIVAAMVATIVLGRAYDAALRHDIMRGDGR